MCARYSDRDELSVQDPGDMVDRSVLSRRRRLTMLLMSFVVLFIIILLAIIVVVVVIVRMYISYIGWLGNVVVGRWTCDREVAGSTPDCRIAE